MEGPRPGEPFGMRVGRVGTPVASYKKASHKFRNLGPHPFSLRGNEVPLWEETVEKW